MSEEVYYVCSIWFACILVIRLAEYDGYCVGIQVEAASKIGTGEGDLMRITKQPENTKLIRRSHFETFYCTDDNGYHTLGEAIKEYEKDRGYPRYFGKMRCPECFKAILIFNAGGTNKHGTRIRQHLKTKTGSYHEPSCAHQLAGSSKKAAEEVAGQINKDTADSMMSAHMNKLFRRDSNNDGYQPIHETEDASDEISSAGSNGKTQSLHSKSLNTGLPDIQHSIPMVFSGKVKLTILKPNDQKDYSFLVIKPFPSNIHTQDYQIYLGNEECIVDTTAVYYLVALARAEKAKAKYPRTNLAPIGVTNITFHIYEQVIDLL
jgi:hypothetical protein